MTAENQVPAARDSEPSTSHTPALPGPPSLTDPVPRVSSYEHMCSLAAWMEQYL